MLPSPFMRSPHEHAGLICSGELREYVIEEVNVRELQTCDDPDKYSCTSAQPEWGVCSSPCWTGQKVLVIQRGPVSLVGPGNVLLVLQLPPWEPQIY